MRGSGANAVDQYMLSALVELVARSGPRRNRSKGVTEMAVNRRERLEQLWKAVEKGEPASTPRLDAHLAASFINSFGALGSLSAARHVLDVAREADLASTIVRNAYLRACGRNMSLARGKHEGRVRAHAIAEARAVVGGMEGADRSRAPVDGFTCSLVAGVLPLAEAAGVVERAGDAADTVAYNALIDAAGKHGDVPMALSILRRMEEGRGPAPDEASYNSTLAALARSPGEQKWRRQGQGRGSAKRAGSAAAALGNAEDELRASTAPVSEALDRVAEAMSLRERMAQRGIEESDVTRSTLFRLYADTPMAESVAASAARPAAQARPLAAGSAARSAAGSAGAGSAAAGSAAAADSAAAATEPATDTAGRLRRSLEEGARSSREIWQLLDDGSLAAEGLDAPLVLTDLRGLTRAAAALELRHELTRAAQRFELGIGASGRGEDPLAMEPSVRSHWAIVAGAEARRTQSSGVARHADSQPQLSAQRGGAPKVTLRTALEFLFAEGIEYEQKRPGLLLVPPDEYERAAARMANRMRRQKLRDGLVYYWCFVASGLATMSIIPRLDHLVGGLGGGGLPGA
jgi:pentatricopeptide repeat protein